MKHKIDSHHHRNRRIERLLRIAFVLFLLTGIMAALAWLVPVSETIARR